MKKKFALSFSQERQRKGRQAGDEEGHESEQEQEGHLLLRHLREDQGLLHQRVLRHPQADPAEADLLGDGKDRTEPRPAFHCGLEDRREHDARFGCLTE